MDHRCEIAGARSSLSRRGLGWVDDGPPMAGLDTSDEAQVESDGEGEAGAGSGRFLGRLLMRDWLLVRLLGLEELVVAWLGAGGAATASRDLECDAIWSPEASRLERASHVSAWGGLFSGQLL